MSKFEKLCNEYRENKRLIEELTAMNVFVYQLLEIPGREDGLGLVIGFQRQHLRHFPSPPVRTPT